MTTTHNVDLGFTPRSWQAETYKEIKAQGASRIVLEVHRQAGKTEFASMFELDEALKLQLPLGRYLYVAPYLKQAKATAWDRQKAYASRIPHARILEAEVTIELPNGAKLVLGGADDPDSLRGTTLDGVILDELAQMKRDTWETVIAPQLAARNGWAMFIGTVKGMTLLSELFRKAQQDTLLDEKGRRVWYARKWKWNETRVFSDFHIELMRRSMSEAQFRQEMECDETASTVESLIPMALIIQQSGKSLRKEAFDHEAKIIGVDVAYAHDGDRSVIAKRQGLHLHPLWSQRGIDNMALASEIARQYHEWDADAIMIDAGRGEGVISALTRLGLSQQTLPVHFGGRPDDPALYVNKKAEIMMRMKTWLESGGILPDSHELQVDLGVLRMDRSDRTDRLAVEVDETMPSPDLACAIACTFAYVVRPKARTDIERFEAQAMQARDEAPYDFFARADRL